MYPNRNSFPEHIRAKANDTLILRLVNAFDRGAQVKQARWKVRGPAFLAIHEPFNRIAGETGPMLDMIDVRAEGPGSTARVTIPFANERTLFAPYLQSLGSEERHLAPSVGLWRHSVRRLGFRSRKRPTSVIPILVDLFAGISRNINKELWLIESHHGPE